MLALHKNLASAKTPHRESIGKESVQRQVASTDGAIDKLVYELSHSLRFGDDIWVE